MTILKLVKKLQTEKCLKTLMTKKLNKKDSVTDTITYIKTLEPMTALERSKFSYR